MPPPTTPVSLQPRHQSYLKLILRDANVQYQYIADATRRSLHPTHHAKKHASSLGLAVDIKKAVNCSQRQVSVIPLPILDTSPSPTAPAPLHHTQDSSDHWEERRSSPLHRRPALKCATPTLTVPSQRRRSPASADVPRSTSGLTPLSSSLIPAPSVLRGQNVPWRGPSSRFSVTPVDTIPKIRIPSPCERAKHVAADNDNEDADADIEMPATPVLGHRGLPDVPVNEDELNWELESVDMDISPMSPVSSNSSSNSSSSGPVTPDDASPLTIRIKRKSVEMGGVEKRPRYGRKQWVVPTTQRRMTRLPFRK